MPMGRRFDVFLSYNSADLPLVTRIAEALRAEHLEPWWDRWALTAGMSWQDEIVEGLQRSRACAVIIGQAGLGNWARQELAVAQDLAVKDRGFRIFMVLLPEAPELSDPSLAFLRTRTWVDLRRGLDPDGLEELIAAVVGAPQPRTVTAAAVTCPYKGLEVFDEDDAPFFFGREDDVALVVEKLKHSRFLAILGPSGSGKSSLLRAGLLPALQSGVLMGRTWHRRVFTPGTRPLSALAVQLDRLSIGTSMQEVLDGLWRDERALDLMTFAVLGERPTGEQVLLVVDQFEELFTLCRDEDERAAFVANLVYAATIPGGRVVVVVGMRADFYQRCAEFPDLRLLVAEEQFLVGPLTSEGLVRAIEEPARRVGLQMETGLTETITADVAARPGSLPLLEHLLLELWRRRRGSMLTLEAYVASGGVEGALALRADSAYAALSPSQREIARRVLLRLIQPGEASEDTRRRALMEELVSHADEPGEVEAVVQALADQRLVTTGHDDVSGAAIVEITHEALIRGWPTLRGWIEEDREALRSERHLTETAFEWDRRGRRDDDLYAGSRLAYWKEQDTAALSRLERDFVAAALDREARERGARRRRARMAVGGVVMALTTVAIVALVGLDRVAEQRDIARSRQLAAEATATLRADPAEAVRLAADGYDVARTEEARQALKQALSTPGSRAESLKGHDGRVEDARFSPDGRRVVSVGDDGTVRVWDWPSRAEPIVLRDHQSGVNSGAFGPDGTRVVSAGDDGTVRIREWANGGDPIVLRGHDRWVLSAAFDTGGTHVVSAGADGTVRVWDWDARIERVVLSGHEGAVLDAAFSPDGTRVVTAGADGTVRVWDWEAGGRSTVVGRHDGGVASTAFSPQGRHVLSAGDNGAVLIWDSSGAGPPVVLRGHRGRVDDAGFNADGTRVVSAGDDGTVRVWDWRTGRERAVLPGHDGRVNTARFNSDGTRVVSAGDDGMVRVWGWAASAEPAVLEGHEGAVLATAFSPDGVRVVSAGEDATVRVWEWATGRERALLRGHEGPVNSAGFSPDGTLVVSAGTDGTVRVWDWAATRQVITLRGHRGSAESAEFSPDGNLVVSAGLDGEVRVWNTAAPDSVTVLSHYGGAVGGAAFSPDGTHVVSAGEDRTVRIWEWALETEVAALRGHERFVNGVAFNSDGRGVAGGSEDETARIWDWTVRRELAVLRGHRGSVHTAAFSLDGDRVVTAGDDGTVRIWDSASGDELRVLRGHERWVSSAAFHRDGAYVASSGADGTVRVWDCTACYSIERLVAVARSPL